MPDGLPAELPALAPHPPGQARILHPFGPSGLRTRGRGVGGCGADLSCCAWQEASQTQQAEKGAGIHKHVNYLKFNRHGSCRGPGGRVCLCLLFHYFPSLGPVASGWSPIKLPSIGFIHPSIHPSIHPFSKIFSKLKDSLEIPLLTLSLFASGKMMVSLIPHFLIACDALARWSSSTPETPWLPSVL